MILCALHMLVVFQAILGGGSDTCVVPRSRPVLKSIITRPTFGGDSEGVEYGCARGLVLQGLP